jgi:hypothetical protein
MVTINELMTIERFLLEIENRFKFDLSFDKTLKLYKLLKEIGRITNFFFLLQDEYYKKFNDSEKLKEYRNKLSGDRFEFDTDESIKFIDEIYDTTNDEEFKNIVLKNRFWKN